MTLPNRATRRWSYPEATESIPYVRRLLGSLREHFIAAWHYYRLDHLDPDEPAHKARLAFHRREGVAALEDLHELDVLPYESPLRGIALFPLLVHDHGTPGQQAYLVYKDPGTTSTATSCTTTSAPTATCWGGSGPCRRGGWVVRWLGGSRLACVSRSLAKRQAQPPHHLTTQPPSEHARR
jgi:hypothetical protein